MCHMCGMHPCIESTDNSTSLPPMHRPTAFTNPASLLRRPPHHPCPDATLTASSKILPYPSLPNLRAASQTHWTPTVHTSRKRQPSSPTNRSYSSAAARVTTYLQLPGSPIHALPTRMSPFLAFHLHQRGAHGSRVPTGQLHHQLREASACFARLPSWERSRYSHGRNSPIRSCSSDLFCTPRRRLAPQHSSRINRAALPRSLDLRNHHRRH